MWELTELAMMPRLPSEVAEKYYGMRFTEASRLDFDKGMLWYRRWVEGKRNETTWGASEEPPGKGQVRVPRYRTMEEIYAEYDDTWDRSKFASPIDGAPDFDMDAVIEDAFGDDVLF